MLIHRGTSEIKTDRFILRRFTTSDADDMFKNYASDHRVTRFLSWTPYENVDGVKLFLSSLIERYSDDNVYHWAIEYDSQVVGSISVITIDNKNRSCEMGYCLSYDYWNKGITSEAMQAVIKFLFTEVNVHRIVAKHDVENPASGEVMKKCGMTYEGRLREHYLRHDGTFSDSLVYAILKS